MKLSYLKKCRTESVVFLLEFDTFQLMIIRASNLLFFIFFVLCVAQPAMSQTDSQQNLPVVSTENNRPQSNETVSRQARFYCPKTDKELTLSLISPFGTVNNRSRQALSRIAYPSSAAGRPTLLHPRLLLMLQRIADQYAGKRIIIVSANRPETDGYSDEHTLGRAVDLRVEGITQKKLYDYVKTLPKCGTGYYPKSDFVHLDVRDELETWIDFFHTNEDCRLETTHDVQVGKPVEFLSIWNNEKATLPLISESGAVNNRSRQKLSQLAASKVKGTRIILLHPRLILMLQKVADQFPDHRFELVSGYRLGERKASSPHNYGRALDFRLYGVDNAKLYEFVKTLPKCGTGYYPNSVFIHFDVRDKTTTWIDYSGVGEASDYKLPKGSGKKKNKSKLKTDVFE